VYVGKGREHDFALYKRAKIVLHLKVQPLADGGYQGIKELHPQAQHPKRKPRKAKLTKAEKQENRRIAGLRIGVEHVLRRLKVFRILKEVYRNKRKRFGLRANLIAAIYNRDHLGISA
jgi:hypothetical protein